MLFKFIRRGRVIRRRAGFRVNFRVGVRVGVRVRIVRLFLEKLRKIRRGIKYQKK